MDVPADAPLRRPTARARRALVWAQACLAGLVVLAAAAVGGTVQERIDGRDARLPDPIRVPVAAVQARAVQAEAVPAPPLPGVTDPAEAGHEGSLAALGTLLVGWTLTAAGGTVGRRRLEEREHDRWAAGWAGVEPLWSGRVP